MRATIHLICLAVSVTAAGCGPGQQDFGKIVPDIPKIPGAEKPYQIPKADPQESAKTDEKQPAESPVPAAGPPPEPAAESPTQAK